MRCGSTANKYVMKDKNYAYFSVAFQVLNLLHILSTELWDTFSNMV